MAKVSKIKDAKVKVVLETIKDKARYITAKQATYYVVQIWVDNCIVKDETFATYDAAFTTFTSWKRSLSI